MRTPITWLMTELALQLSGWKPLRKQALLADHPLRQQQKVRLFSKVSPPALVTTFETSVHRVPSPNDFTRLHRNIRAIRPSGHLVWLHLILDVSASLDARH